MAVDVRVARGGWFAVSALLSLNRVAIELNCSIRTVRRLIDDAELAAVTMGGRKYVAEDELSTFIARRTTLRRPPSRDEVLKLSARVPRYGVYFLFHKDEIVYIGSGNVMSRIGRHLKDSGKQFTRFAIIETPDLKSARKLEADSILKFKPRLNKMLNPDHVRPSKLLPLE